MSVVSRIESVGCTVALAVTLDRADPWVRFARQRIGRIFLSSRRSLKSGILLDCQCSMKNITLNDRGAI